MTKKIAANTPIIAELDAAEARLTRGGDTFDTYKLEGIEGEAVSADSDILRGRNGNDVLIGNQGSDF